MVCLKPMTGDDFGRFRAYSITSFAEDLIIAETLPRKEAFAQAERSFGQLLPDGPDPENHFLMTVSDAQTGTGAGWIWFFFEEAENVRRVWLADLFIFENERRKGFASAALAEMERTAKENGCVESALWVWDHNTAGRGLYEKCGYRVSENGSGGAILKKSLS